MNSITITAPAKINLTLDVTGRRADGYHTISTIMQSVSLSDTVYISKAGDGISVECTDSSIPCGEGHIRISYVYSLKHLMEAVERIEEFLKEIGS